MTQICAAAKKRTRRHESNSLVRSRKMAITPVQHGHF